MILQNYCNLTLIDMTIDQSDSDICKYVVSNNCGSFTTKGETILKAAPGRVVFDVWYGMNEIYDDGITINIGMGTELVGKIEYGAASRVTTTDWVEKASVEISETVDLSETTFVVIKAGITPNYNTKVINKGGMKATQFMTSTYIDTGNIPQTDTTIYRNRARFTTNGDIRKDGKSVITEKMNKDAQSYQTSKNVINSFPVDASAYYKTLDFKVNNY